MNISQWPRPSNGELLSKTIKSLRLMVNGKNNNILFIEAYFEKLLMHPVVLSASGRNAIYSILKIHNISRISTIFITKFSSYCMYQSIGSLANISTDFYKPDVVLVNHKWGNVNSDSRIDDKHVAIIEDSCDSLILAKDELFKNNGDYEIISLSKVLGSVSGALIVLNTGRYQKNKKDFILEQKGYAFFSYLQFARKLIRIFNKSSTRKPLAFEHLNFYVNAIEVALIRAYLNEYEQNAALILRRKNKIFQLLGKSFNSPKRIGPGVVVELKEECISQVEFFLLNGMVIRHFDLKLTNDSNAVYKRILFVPLHRDVNEKNFKKYFEFLKIHIDCILDVI